MFARSRANLFGQLFVEPEPVNDHVSLPCEVSANKAEQLLWGNVNPVPNARKEQAVNGTDSVMVRLSMAGKVTDPHVEHGYQKLI